MATKRETTGLLLELNEALDDLIRIWDAVEIWSEANFKPDNQQAA